MPKPTNPRDYFFSPSESARLMAEYQERVRQEPGVQFGIPSIDRVLIPQRAGNVVGHIARPGHGKSSILAYLAVRTARWLVAGEVADRCVVYITLENSVEEMEALFMAEEPWTNRDYAEGKVPKEEFLRKYGWRTKLPIWVIGRSEHRREKRLEFTVERLFEAIRGMEQEYQLRPILACLDYIQIVEGGSGQRRDKTEQTAEAIHQTKNLALELGIPFDVGVQAGRAVDKREDRIPDIADCQWSSAMEQVGDKLFGWWRPWLTRKRDDFNPKVKLAGQEVEVTRELLVGRLAKQRMADAGQLFYLRFDPGYVRLADLELSLVGEQGKMEIPEKAEEEPDEAQSGISW